MMEMKDGVLSTISDQQRWKNQLCNCQVFGVQCSHARSGSHTRGGQSISSSLRLPWSCTACFTNCPRTRGRWSANLFLLWYRTWKWQTAIRKKPVLTKAFSNTSYTNKETKIQNPFFVAYFRYAIKCWELQLIKFLKRQIHNTDVSSKEVSPREVRLVMSLSIMYSNYTYLFAVENIMFIIPLKQMRRS